VPRDLLKQGNEVKSTESGRQFQQIISADPIQTHDRATDCN